jgi:hypothetical protein
MEELVEELAEQVCGQGERPKTRELTSGAVIARPGRAISRARAVQERTAAPFARLESTRGIRCGRALEAVTYPPAGNPPGRRPGPSPVVPIAPKILGW